MKRSSPFGWHSRVIGGVAIAFGTACASGVLGDPYAGFSSDAGIGTTATDAGGSGDSSRSEGGEGTGTMGADGGVSADDGWAAADSGDAGDDGVSTDVRGNDDGGYADRAVSDAGPSQEAGSSDGAGSDAGDPCAQYSASCAKCTPNRGGPGCGWCNGSCHQGTSGGPASAGACGATAWIWKSSGCPRGWGAQTTRASVGAPP